MRLINYQRYLWAILVYISAGASVYAQPQPQPQSLYIASALSEKVNIRFEKYLLYSYRHLGYKITFEKILVARSREMADVGRLDALLIAEKEIENSYKNLLRVPVILAKISFVLYCVKEVNCQKEALDDASNMIGVVSGNSISANFMRSKLASTYAIKGADSLGVMLTMNRLNYILMMNEDQLGSVGNLDETQFQKTELFRTEGYHYIHKKHKKLLPELTQALQLAIDELGPLVGPSTDTK